MSFKKLCLTYKTRENPVGLVTDQTKARAHCYFSLEKDHSALILLLFSAHFSTALVPHDKWLPHFHTSIFWHKVAHFHF